MISSLLVNDNLELIDGMADSLFGKKFLAVLQFFLEELVTCFEHYVEIAAKCKYKSSEGLRRISALEDYVEFQRRTWIVKVN